MNQEENKPNTTKFCEYQHAGKCIATGIELECPYSVHDLTITFKSGFNHGGHYAKILNITIKNDPSFNPSEGLEELIRQDIIKQLDENLLFNKQKMKLYD